MAIKEMNELAADLRQKRYSKSADTIDRFSQDIWNHRAFPKEHCKKIRTTNGLERIHKELKRRSRVVSVPFRMTHRFYKAWRCHAHGYQRGMADQ